ncbi:type II toxin-antitoxin system RelE/ParE family toxin [Collinsella sp. D33t1_170424_A12]|uniref:type II toxin-antitoxin system RelE/ParE family toxin n=1 Tax=Collinsella sp. D33t1_170424_A12 TaxID=2787135 RepID=UPI001899583A|nr:type II toxin-antitoxin system RelE/ParE family toxin [Collinsella sp. D33t1_170424_A12]
MGYRLSITREAQREYRDIVSYLVDVLKSPRAARHFMAEFDAQVESVRNYPEAFSLCHLPELAARGYRSASVMRYTFLYTVRADEVIIAHVFHQSQDYARLV